MHAEEQNSSDRVPTAFRRAEKLYKLPPPAQGRRRKKLRAADLGVPAEAPQPLDFRSPEHIKQLVVYSTADESAGPHTIYGLQTHPGFFFLPSSVPPHAQRSFLEDIAGQLLEPPAATNLTAAHGPLPGLWRAAAEDLRLRAVAGRPSPAHAASAASHVSGSDAPPAPAVSLPNGDQAPCHACSSEPGSSSQHLGPIRAVPAAEPGCSTQTFKSTWCPNGAGASAAALLRKLRWLTVGPRYDWTDRRYDFQGPHHPLPAYAAALARDLVLATEQAVQVSACPQPQQHQARQMDATSSTVLRCQATAAHRQPLARRHVRPCECQYGQLRRSDSHADGSAPAPEQEHHPRQGQQLACGPTQQASYMQQHSADTQQCRAVAGSQRLAVAPWQSRRKDQQQQQQQEEEEEDAHDIKQAFLPDAALVCFYRAGDTLCGHRDDVERDLSQPIVSLSLGCTAILLLGGHSRSDPPTPLLVRHGDAVVFSGPARMYYHGVPRVFDDGPGEDGLSKLGSLSPARRDFVQHNRINISVRCVS